MKLIEFEKKFIRIVKDNLNEFNLHEFSYKDDQSLVTELDIKIEMDLRKFLSNNFKGIKIIGEELIENHKEFYDFSDKKFAIIDPIDGTENFIHLNNLYGSVISVIYNDFEYHGIYIPSIDIIISNISNKSKFRFESNIKVLSTSCYNNYNIESSQKQNIRIIGSSSFMFYMLLSGIAKEYLYCGKSKIWDYFTGIKLINYHSDIFDCTINKMKIDEFLNQKLIPHFASFSIKNKNNES